MNEAIALRYLMGMIGRPHGCPTLRVTYATDRNSTRLSRSFCR